MPFIGKKTESTGVFSGIKSSLNLPPAPLPTDVFTGGAEIDVDGVRFHFFGNGSHNWSSSTGGSFNAIITAGGGGGGDNSQGHAGGGGGAGQVNKGTLTLTAGQTGSFSIGTGGLNGSPGANGGDSTVTTGGSTYTLKGGGGGGSNGQSAPGSNGGSGGGGGARQSSSAGTSNKTSDFLGLTSYGENGGTGHPGDVGGQNAGGGGGGPWTTGTAAVSRQKAGRGGAPYPPISIGGSQLSIASGGGGGASAYERHGSGGFAYVNGGEGGGGIQGKSAVPDTGSGGGGAGTQGDGGHGADGCAVIWYPSPGGASNSYSKLNLELDFDPAYYGDTLNLTDGTTLTDTHHHLEGEGNFQIQRIGSPVFNTGNGGYVSTGNNNAIRCAPHNNGQYTLNASSEITISGWFYVQSNARQVLVSRWQTQFNHLCDPNGGFHFNNTMVGCGSGDIGDAESYNLNTWHYITWAYSGSTAVHCWWVDGHPLTTLTVGDGSVATSSSTETGNITIGTRTDGGEWLTGRVGPVRIYSRALTSGEILADYENTRSRFGV